MNSHEVERRVAEIAAVAGDSEQAHSLEDNLYRDVLRSIAEGNANPRGVAQAALACDSIRFQRGCV